MIVPTLSQKRERIGHPLTWVTEGPGFPFSKTIYGAQADPVLFDAVQLNTSDEPAAIEFRACGISAENASFRDIALGAAGPDKIDIAT